MILQKVFLNPAVEEQIRFYRKLSLFVQKYGLVIVAFTFSLFFLILNFYTPTKVVSYSNSINNNNLIFQQYIGKYPSFTIKRKDIYLEGKYLFSKTNYNKVKFNLGLGLFIATGKLQLPSFSSFNILLLKGLNKSSFTGKAYAYLSFLMKLNYLPVDLKLHKFSGKTLTIEEFKKDYNLSCMDSFLNNSVFCNTNKFYLISSLLNNKVDLTSKAYDYLFKNLFISDEKKCDIIKKIYSKKLNYQNLKDIISSYCDPEQFLASEDVLNNYSLSNLFTSSLPKTLEGQLFKLVNQWVYLLHTENISSDIINSHILYVKNLMNNLSLSKFYMYLEYEILTALKKNNSADDKTISSVNILLKGDVNSGFKGLVYYLGDLIKTNHQDALSLIIASTKNIQSVREKLIKLISRNYNKYFELIDRPNNDSSVQLLTGNIFVYEKQNNRLNKYKLPVVLKVNLKSVIGKKFTIDTVNVLDPKVESYLQARNITLPVSTDLISLSNFFADVLANYYLNGGKEKLDLCAKARILSLNSCYKNIITVQNQSPNYSLKFIFSGGYINEVDGPEIIKVNVDYAWAGKEVIRIDLGRYLQKINSLLTKQTYDLYAVKKIAALINKYIEKYKQAYISKITGMPVFDLLNLKSLLSQYLNANLIKVEKVKANIYKLYFSLGNYKIIALYDKKRNLIFMLALYSKKARKIIPLGKVRLYLSDVSLEQLNKLKLNPDTFFSQLNSVAFNKYLTLEKQN